LYETHFFHNLDSEWQFQLFGAILAQVRPDNNIGGYCLEYIYKLEKDQMFYLKDRVLSLCPLLNRDLRAIPVENLLVIVNPLEADIHELGLEDFFPWETFICRIIWGCPHEIVKQGVGMIREIVNVLHQDIPEPFFDVIIMEVVLTELAAGISNENDVQDADVDCCEILWATVFRR
jgi:hypothetical protein